MMMYYNPRIEDVLRSMRKSASALKQTSPRRLADSREAELARHRAEMILHWVRRIKEALQ